MSNHCVWFTDQPRRNGRRERARSRQGEAIAKPPMEAKRCLPWLLHRAIRVEHSATTVATVRRAPAPAEVQRPAAPVRFGDSPADAVSLA